MRLVSVVDFVHHFRCTTVWMTIIAGSAVIGISSNALVLIVHLRLRVAGGGAGKYRIISRIGMTIGTGIPLILMFS
jgi:hypothetical protein